SSGLLQDSEMTTGMLPPRQPWQDEPMQDMPMPLPMQPWQEDPMHELPKPNPPQQEFPKQDE
ncbi:MAG: hypothetical protein ACRCZF_20790, partial [Gemmataceae bacterium]